MGEVADWNCTAGAIFTVVLMLSLNLVLKFTQSISRCVFQVIFKVHVFVQGNQMQRSQCSFCVPHIFVYTQDWAGPGFHPGFHQPPASNSQHPWAPRKPNSLWCSLPESYGTSPSWSCIKITFLCRGFPRFPMSQTEQTDKFNTPPSFLILLPGSSQRQSPSLLYPPQAHNSIGYCCKGFTICMRLLQISSVSQG